jgi:two-component system, NtrC family, response regulator AtoC
MDGAGGDSGLEPTIKNEAPAHSIHLLDDDSDWLLFLFEYLSNAGYHVTAASCIEDSLILLGRSHPEVLIADRDVPGLTEIELLDRVRFLSPSTRIILTTERPAGPSSGERLWFGGMVLLSKPIEWPILMRAVERAVREPGVRHLVE